MGKPELEHVDLACLITVLGRLGHLSSMVDRKTEGVAVSVFVFVPVVSLF